MSASPVPFTRMVTNLRADCGLSNELTFGAPLGAQAGGVARLMRITGEQDQLDIVIQGMIDHALQ
jgi:hypothetical protein